MRLVDVEFGGAQLRAVEFEDAEPSVTEPGDAGLERIASADAGTRLGGVSGARALKMSSRAADARQPAARRMQSADTVAVAGRVASPEVPDADFSSVQLKALRGRLQERHVRSRQQGGIEIRYIEGWHAISEANRIFGFGGWSRETALMTCIFLKPVGGHFTACYTARIRIRVSAGGREIVRDGTGFGQATADTAALAHELSAKAAETDATKRALATFGARFGLELASGRHGEAKGQLPGGERTSTCVNPR